MSTGNQINDRCAGIQDFLSYNGEPASSVAIATGMKNELAGTSELNIAFVPLWCCFGGKTEC